MTADPATKRRQLIAIFLALVALFATIQLYRLGADGLLIALSSYFVLTVFIVYANRKALLVKEGPDS